MSDWGAVFVAVLIGAAFGLYFRVWVVVGFGLVVSVAAFLLAQSGNPGLLARLFVSVEVLFGFDVGYMLGAFLMVPRPGAAAFLPKDRPETSDHSPRTKT
jgi:hypothetical protein